MQGPGLESEGTLKMSPPHDATVRANGKTNFGKLEVSFIKKVPLFPLFYAQSFFLMKFRRRKRFKKKYNML